MKIYFIIDDKKCVYPCCDYKENIDPEEEWYIGEINGDAYESHGIPLYKLVNGNIIARSKSEIQSDIDALPVSEPNETERLRADIDYLLMLAEEE